MFVFARLKILAVKKSFHDSRNSSGNGSTQTDKQNDDGKETTIASQNITSGHPSLNHYHVFLVLLQIAVLRLPLSAKKHVIN